MKVPMLNEIAGLLTSSMVRGWMETLDARAWYFDERVDPTHPAFQGPKIFVFWHEYILAPLAFRGRSNLAMLLSRHRDADVLHRVAMHMGFETVRGSTNRGGAAALRELIDHGKNLNIAITPDGPRGPRRILAQGPVYLASKLQLPLVPFGIGYDKPWRAKSWDRFALPRPFSRLRSVIGPEMIIPENLDRDGIESHRVHVQETLTALTIHAENWAERGGCLENDLPIRREAFRYFAARPTPRIADETQREERMIVREIDHSAEQRFAA